MLSKGVRIAGSGAVSALGLSREDTWSALVAGRRALAGAPPAARIDRALARRALAERAPSWVSSLASPREEPRPEELFLALALEEATRGRALASGTTAIVIGSTKGSPTATSGGALGSLVGFARRLTGASGPALAVSQACASGTAALALGASLVEEGACDRALVAGVEALTPFVADGFAALMALDERGARPFDRSRAGLSLGEGAAAFLLEAADERPGVHLRGWASASDASHPTSPDREGRGLERALRLALARAEAPPEAMALACAHGTGTERNDPAELAAYGRVFAHALRVFSIKGAVGHTLGAAGALDALCATLALERGEVPGTAGLEQPLPSTVALSAATARVSSPRFAVSSNAGFGGLNAALVFERVA